MATVTAVIVVLAFLSGCVTAVVGVWVGRGQSPVSLVLNWAAATLVLQALAACIAIVHARVGPSDHRIAERTPAPDERDRRTAASGSADRE
jgi:hypothetical protein